MSGLKHLVCEITAADDRLSYIFGCTPDARRSRTIAVLNRSHEGIKLLDELDSEERERVIRFLQAQHLHFIPSLAKLSLLHEKPHADLRAALMCLIPPILQDNLVHAIDICLYLSKAAIVPPVPLKSLNRGLARTLFHYQPEPARHGVDQIIHEHFLKPIPVGAPLSPGVVPIVEPELATSTDFSEWESTGKAKIRCPRCPPTTIMFDYPRGCSPDISHIVNHVFTCHHVKKRKGLMDQYLSPRY